MTWRMNKLSMSEYNVVIARALHCNFYAFLSFSVYRVPAAVSVHLRALISAVKLQREK